MVVSVLVNLLAGVGSISIHNLLFERHENQAFEPLSPSMPTVFIQPFCDSIISHA